MISVVFLYLQGLIHFPDLVEAKSALVFVDVSFGGKGKMKGSVRFFRSSRKLNLHFIIKPQR